MTRARFPLGQVATHGAITRLARVEPVERAEDREPREQQDDSEIWHDFLLDRPEVTVLSDPLKYVGYADRIVADNKNLIKCCLAICDHAIQCQADLFRRS